MRSDPISGRGGLALRRIAACCIAMAAGGCAVGPDFARPTLPSPERYERDADPVVAAASGVAAQRFDRSAAVPADWWRLFGSSRLDGLVEAALDGNYSLQAALASLRQSQDQLQAGYGVFLPQLDGAFDAERQKALPARLGQGGPGAIFNLFTWSATASYTLDLFGGERRAVEGLAAQRDQQRQFALAAYISLTGNVVNTAVAQAAYAEEADILRQVIALRREQVDIAQAQAQAGTAPQSAALSLQVQLAGAEAQLPQLLQAQQQAAHLLAVLGGHPPGEGAGPAPSLAELQLPQRLPESLPAELVRQRPDVLAAEAELHARSAAIGVATAAMLPSISLSGSYGRGGSGFSALGPAAGAFWSAGAGVTAPLFQGGTLWYQRRAAVDAYQQSLASYRQTVLTAFSQVADALRALEHDAMILGAQSEASAAAEQNLELAQAGFRGGTIGYLDLASANDQALQARLALVQARAQRCQDTAALFVALGGGWWNAPTAPSGLPQLAPVAAASP